MLRSTAATVAIALAVTACSGGSSGDAAALDDAQAAIVALEQEREELVAEVDDMTSELEELAGDELTAEEAAAATQALLVEAEGALTDMAAELEKVVSARTDAETELAEVEGRLVDAIVERNAAVAERDALLVRFDPEIQAAVAVAQQQAEDAACAAGDAYGFDPTLVRPSADSIVRDALTGLPDGTAIDIAAVEAQLAACVAAGEQRAAEAALKEPKGDGFWTVGLEIAAGRWRSTGTQNDCYWSRTPDGRPDDIVDNHFGNAGGTVTLREGEEFETDDCGVWEYVG